MFFTFKHSLDVDGVVLNDLIYFWCSGEQKSVEFIGFILANCFERKRKHLFATKENRNPLLGPVHLFLARALARMTCTIVGQCSSEANVHTCTHWGSMFNTFVRERADAHADRRRK